ncbi:hypothetical protein BDN72DRAFT_831519 [Pluteus cervinus]|uniref:Uncharacterized protein n=1 Tax=Pluteus cervinus TaxID=181527 RepID=A0ACD3BD23_9AGAR|nr:hypothetical protein BDN72DRAFT_831519 [Pluteus cervinus]
MSYLRLFRARLVLGTPPLVRSVHNAPPTPAKKSPHGQWYSDVVPSMIPIFLLGSAVYLVRKPPFLVYTPLIFGNHRVYNSHNSNYLMKSTCRRHRNASAN